jgi:metal-sulfur cluster biosynthetic enzyme
VTPLAASRDDEIVDALRRVPDPCSIGQGRPMSIYDLGLVCDWELRDDVVSVRMCVTSPICGMAPHFLRQAREELERIPGIREARCHVDAAVFWTPERMSAEGSERLRAQRARTMAQRGQRPVAGRPDAPATFTGPTSRPAHQ